MCLIVFAWQPGHALPLLVAANRDEFYARPSLPLAAWGTPRGYSPDATWRPAAPGWGSARPAVSPP